MSSPKPSTIEIDIPSLGRLKGFEFPNGVKYFSSIPYGRLSKRWTRASLAESWESGYHDGTKLGQVPNMELAKIIYPVEKTSHFIEDAGVDELKSLTINITVPPLQPGGATVHPVFAYVHGGSFIHGGANEPTLHGVNLVSRSVEKGKPVVHVNFMYRTGFGEFLASQDIRDDLQRDGYSGVGNFGLTDQALAFDWIQKFICLFNGDKENESAIGESAGSASICHHFRAAQPPTYHRAGCMSGQGPTGEAWPLERHELLYQALLRHLNILPGEGALEELRMRPQLEISAATAVVNGVAGGTCNTCDDGWYYSKPPSFSDLESPPSWLKSFMVGDCRDEGLIYRENIAEDTYEDFHSTLGQYIGEQNATAVLEMYDIYPSLEAQDVRLRMEELLGDVNFKILNWMVARQSTIPATFAYHYDQLYELPGPLKGTAFHGSELIHLFMNHPDIMASSEGDIAREMADCWISFVHGEDPWERFSRRNAWMIFGKNITQLELECEEEGLRHYERFRRLVSLDYWPGIGKAVDEIGLKRSRIGRN
ncbi:unnamed protein product [Penicillium salamii]|nr:unnamed protein product [Penicillium salamii]